MADHYAPLIILQLEGVLNRKCDFKLLGKVSPATLWSGMRCLVAKIRKLKQCWGES